MAQRVCPSFAVGFAPLDFPYGQLTQTQTRMKTKQKRGPNHIYSMRRNRSIRQKHLATLLGRNERCISHYESGDGLPTLEAAVLLQSHWESSSRTSIPICIGSVTRWSCNALSV